MSLSSKSLAVLQREALLFGSNVVTSIVIARALGPHALGLWVILALIPSYAETLARVKVDAAAVFLLGKGTYQVGDVVASLHLVALATGGALVAAVVIWREAFVRALFGESGSEVALLVYVMLAQIPVNFLYMNYMYLHISREDVRSLNFMVMTRALGTSALVVGALLLFDLGLRGVAVGSTVGLTLALIIGAWRFGRTARTGPLLQPAMLRDLFAYGGRLYIGNMLSYLNTYSSQAIVVAFCPPAQVAFFTLAQQLAQMLNKITEAMGTFLFPYITRQETMSAAKELAARAFRVSLAILLPAVAAALLLIRPAVFLMYGRSYEPVLGTFYLIVPGIAMIAATTSLTVFFQGIGRADLVAKVAVVPFLLQVALGLLLVPRLQTTGAALALLVSMSITTVLQIYIFCRVSGASWVRDVMPRWRDFVLVIDFIRHTLRQKLLPAGGGASNT